ncbi:MAG: hypothetical protein ABL921_18945 [Pirellula sp.]
MNAQPSTLTNQPKCSVLFVRLTRRELDAIHAEAAQRDISVQALAAERLGLAPRRHYHYRGRNPFDGQSSEARGARPQTVETTLAQRDSES